MFLHIWPTATELDLHYIYHDLELMAFVLPLKDFFFFCNDFLQNCGGVTVGPPIDLGSVFCPSLPPCMPL